MGDSNTGVNYLKKYDLDEPQGDQGPRFTGMRFRECTFRIGYPSLLRSSIWFNEAHFLQCSFQIGGNIPKGEVVLQNHLNFSNAVFEDCTFMAFSKGFFGNVIVESAIFKGKSLPLNRSAQALGICVVIPTPSDTAP